MRFHKTQLHNAPGSEDNVHTVAVACTASTTVCAIAGIGPRNATATTDLVVKALLCSSAASDALQSLYTTEQYNNYLCEAQRAIMLSSMFNRIPMVFVILTVRILRTAA